MKRLTSIVPHAITFRRRIAALFAAVGCLACLPAASAHAQGLVSVGAGVGGGVGDRNKDISGSGAHAGGYVQLHLPIIPFALRFDALFSKLADSSTALSLLGDAVVIAPLPFVQPYALLGYGTYGVGKDVSRSGWNAGVGARVRTPWVAVYAEARRHQRISRDLLTIGISR